MLFVCTESKLEGVVLNMAGSGADQSMDMLEMAMHIASEDSGKHDFQVHYAPRG